LGDLALGRQSLTGSEQTARNPVGNCVREATVNGAFASGKLQILHHQY
jgi:hypothetical protein